MIKLSKELEKHVITYYHHILSTGNKEQEKN